MDSNQGRDLRMMNKWLGSGRLVRDPELKTTESGISVSTFTVAVDRDRKEPDGSRKADFIDVVAWREKAELMTKYFSKGQRILIEGRLSTRTYTDREGKKRKVYEVIAGQIYFGDSKKDSAGEKGKPTPDDENLEEFDGFEELTGDDLPFFETWVD